MSSAVQPNDLDAEGSVLSAILMRPGCLSEVREILQPAHFWADANRHIYAALLDLATSGRGVDVVSLAGLLRDRDQLHKIGGAKYLGQIADATPAAANVAAHAQRVRDMAAKRHVVELARRIAVEGSNGVADVTAWIAEKQHQLANIAGTVARASSSPVEWVVALPEQIFGTLAEPQYLIEGIIRTGGLLEIQAYGGSGKSWFAVNLALSVASGKPFLGRFQVKRCNVVCLDYENGFYEMARRLQANARALGLELPVHGIGVSSMPDAYMTDDGFEGAVAKLAASYQLVIIDTLKAASPGVDENDSRMRESLDRLRRVGERTGCTFVVLIHSKKKSNSTTEIDARERGRGSSAIYDAADAQLGIEYEPGKPLKVVQTKARSGRYIEPFEVNITDGEDGAVHVVATDARQAKTAALNDFDNVCTAVLEVLRANPGASLRLLAEKCNKRHTSVSAALEQLERNGAAKNAGSGNAGRWFAT